MKASSSSGFAMETTEGGLRFIGAAGTATVPGGATSRTVTPGVTLSSNSIVLLTPQEGIGGRSLAASVSGDSFTIHMNESRTNPLHVGYLIVDHG